MIINLHQRTGTSLRPEACRQKLVAFFAGLPCRHSRQCYYSLCMPLETPPPYSGLTLRNRSGHITSTNYSALDRPRHCRQSRCIIRWPEPVTLRNVAGTPGDVMASHSSDSTMRQQTRPYGTRPERALPSRRSPEVLLKPVPIRRVQ